MYIKFKIRLGSYCIKKEVENLREAFTHFCEKLEWTGDYNVILSGPVPLPIRRKHLTVNRSVHADNKAREQFVIKTRKQLWIVRVDPVEGVLRSEDDLFLHPSFSSPWQALILDDALVNFDWTIEKVFKKSRKV